MMMTTYAKPCVNCELYYPGDCYNHGCKKQNCTCDGCMTYFYMEEEEDETHGDD